MVLTREGDPSGWGGEATSVRHDRSAASGRSGLTIRARGETETRRKYKQKH